jgi:predicted amidohydrolase
MLDRLGGAAAAHRMYLICSNDALDSRGVIRNAAIFLGRDGKQIGRYHKVALPVHEQLKEHGDGFPVFQTPDLGGVGMLICYDMVFPESARCLALGGADLIVHPTGGGAAFGGTELSRAAFRTRAVENFVYLVVSWCGWGEDLGSMVISPQGEILAEERRGGEVAMADIDPFGDRQAADWSNCQEDMRARLFRERRPQAYGVLIDPQPAGLQRLPALQPGPPELIARLVQKAMTEGHGQYEQAEAFRKAGETAKAVAAYEVLIAEYPCTWFDRTARQRLSELRGGTGS